MKRVLGSLIWLLASSLPIACVADNSIESAVNQARQTRIAGQYGAAVQQLKPVLAKQPDNFRALYNLALAHAANGERDEAQAAFERASKLLPEQAKPDYSLYNSYGWFLLSTGQLDAADTQFKLAMQHIDQLEAGSQSRLLNNYGILNLQLDRMSEAEKLFTAAANKYDNALAKRNLLLVKTLDKQSERWTVVFGGDRTAAAAADEIQRATKAGIQQPQIVLREGTYRSVATFAERGAAEAALLAAKTFRPDAYIVGWDSWCRGANDQSACKTDF